MVEKPRKKKYEIKRGRNVYFYFVRNLLLHLKVVENKINLRYLIYKFYSCCKYVFYFISMKKGKKENRARREFVLFTRP